MKRLTQLGLILMLLGLSLPAIALAESPSTLQVIGHGRVFVTPDLATVTITVSRSAPDRQLARTRTNRVIGVMIGGLTRIGIDRASIQTSVIALGSRTVGRGTHRRRVYTAEIDLTVTVRRIALLSPLFAVASHAGADGYAGPNFGFTDPSAGMIGASQAALADARRRADAAAGQLGMHVAGVQSVDLDPGSGTQLTSGGSGSATTPASSKPTTPVVPGRQQVDANVQVVYQLASGTI